MSTSSDDLSSDTLERLVGRAAELDDRAAGRISLAQAREIALELGISAAAWDAALAERLHRTSDFVAIPRAGARWIPVLTAAAAFVAGALGGWLSVEFNGNMDVAFGALLVLGGMVVATRPGEKAGRIAPLTLAAWWLSIPAGMMFAMSELLTDPLWFAGFAWIGTTSIAWALPRLLRRLRSSPGPTVASTA